MRECAQDGYSWLFRRWLHWLERRDRFIVIRMSISARDTEEKRCGIADVGGCVRRCHSIGIAHFAQWCWSNTFRTHVRFALLHFACWTAKTIVRSKWINQTADEPTNLQIRWCTCVGQHGDTHNMCCVTFLQVGRCWWHKRKRLTSEMEQSISMSVIGWKCYRGSSSIQYQVWFYKKCTMKKSGAHAAVALSKQRFVLLKFEWTASCRVSKAVEWKTYFVHTCINITICNWSEIKSTQQKSCRCCIMLLE